MSQSTDVLKAALAYCQKRQTILNELGLLLQREITLEETAPATMIAEKPGSKMTARAKKPARKGGPGGKREKVCRVIGGKLMCTRDDVVKVALDVIRANGPATARMISEAVKQKYATGKTGVSQHLFNELKKMAGARLMKNRAGLYDRRDPGKHVDITRTPAESERLLQQARANADRGVPAA